MSTKTIDIVSYVLKVGVTRACVCSYYQVIKHISPGLYMYIYV